MLFRSNDTAIAFVTLIALCLTGFLVSLAAFLSGFSPSAEIPAPDGINQWTAIIFLSLGTGFLEEAFFRVYLPQRILEVKNNPKIAYLISAFVFAVCHAGDGLWAVINALLAAGVLSVVYIKSSSFLGIALAHGFYNILVFFLTS